MTMSLILNRLLKSPRTASALFGLAGLVLVYLFLRPLLGPVGVPLAAGYGGVLLVWTLRRPTALFRLWRLWLFGAVAVFIAVVWLGLLPHDDFYSLSGLWGLSLTEGNRLKAVALTAGAGFCYTLTFRQGWLWYFTVLRGLGNGVVAATAQLCGRERTPGSPAFATPGAATGTGTATTPPKAKAAGTKTAAATETESPAAPPTETADPEPPTPPTPPALLTRVQPRAGAWQLPPPALLTAPDPDDGVPDDGDSVAEMGDRIVATLAEYGVPVSIESVRRGPSVARFGLAPGYGGASGRARVSDIKKRAPELALALKTNSVRIIDRPDPGEGLVGLEVPAPTTRPTPLRAVSDRAGYARLSAEAALPCALGLDTAGQEMGLDLATAPHLLVAGATGSGKSVCINVIISSLLMSRTPDEVRLLLVDPKRVELTPYNGVPHLGRPVVTDVPAAQELLRRLVQEMERRYQILQDAGARKISGYNERNPGQKMPYIVLVVDELADLIMTGGDGVEHNLVRLAQLGRAAGIHLTLATQRPVVKVVTGQLKANVPARIAFAVATQVDSRVILDDGGAEDLAGRGDFLLSAGDAAGARRGQGALISDDEMDRIADFWRRQTA